MAKAKNPFRVGDRVRVTGVESCKGMEGPVKHIKDVPPDGRKSYLVDLGPGVVWCWAEEIERVS